MKDSQGRTVVLFHLKRYYANAQIGDVCYDGQDLYEEIKSGRKTSEWRDDIEFWKKRLLDIAFLSKPLRAWFVCGYPKGNVPRLEADITEIEEHRADGQIEVKFKNVVEVV